MRDEYIGDLNYLCPERRGRHDTCDWVWHPEKLKDGKPGKRGISKPLWWTPLFQCAECGVWGSPKKVTYRSECYRRESGIFNPVFCMSCWNKVRVIVKKHELLDELRMLANRLKRARPDEQIKNY